MSVRAGIFIFSTACVATLIAQPPGDQQFDRFGPPTDEDVLEEYCYFNDEQPHVMFGTKTSYDSTNRGGGGREHLIPNCKPVQFWSLNRHGTRLPKAFKIRRLRQLRKFKDEIVDNYEQRRSYPSGRGRLCPEDYDLLRSWRWNDSVTEEREGSLTAQGTTELKLLARRYRSRFPPVFDRPYDDRTYYFQYALSDRTHDSYQAYIEGLFDNAYYHAHANTMGNDDVIKPYKDCAAWQERTDRNPATEYHYRRFLESPEYYELSRRVFRRLGFRYDPDPQTVLDIYDMCRYEKAWNVDRPSAWCAAFTKDQLRFLEYGDDLKEYYATGYGNPLTERIGCAPIRDLLRRFQKTVDGKSEGNKVTALFTHAATVQAALTTLGVAKDYTLLTADNYRQQARRRWRTSVISPFAANLVAVLHQCSVGDPYKVAFYLNEVPVDDIPGCAVGLCDWEAFKGRFEGLAEGCDVRAFCEGRAVAPSIRPQRALLCAIAAIAFLAQ
ncbi:multiple inositol polyphosphate phosphatase 1 [Cylas formicarius]|uniref:multiple inositol polyphosphate phosphatase 1 n=1 Tax=Cylas formicarius TaxID=197179 RepID=UPI0029583F36|nr:multiple inositol polyphosphate phosphatase 1 [Cylas formicarius]XP_060522506.1 multiple inositol polyphosphate phosphatase 1 [Cylas formicarius]